MKITKGEVLHVARLARLKIEDSQIDKFAGQLGQILEYVETLNQIDTSEVPATSHAVELSNAFREDRPGISLDRKEALANAPESEHGFFMVPRVIES